METIVNKSGNVSYREKVYVNGKSVTKSFLRKSDATSWKRRILSERDRGVALGIAPQKDITFSEYCKLWNERRSGMLAKSSKVRYEGLQRMYLLPYLKAKRLRELDKASVRDLSVALQQAGKSANTVDRSIELLKAMLTDAIDWDYLLVNPVSRFSKTVRTIKREQYWDADEATDFLGKIKDHPKYLLISLAINTGLRRSELSGLLFSNSVSFANNTLDICRMLDRYGEREEIKTKRRRVLPMSPIVRQILGELYRRKTSDYVFSDEHGKPLNLLHISREFRALQAKVSVKKIIRWHDLRHIYSAIFLMSGGDIYTLSKFLGHTRIETTERYSHLTQSHLAQEAARVSVGMDPRGFSPHLAQQITG
jgi:integrase